jgi:hypothetical protein
MTKDEISKRIDWILTIASNSMANLRKDHDDLYAWSPTEWNAPFKAAVHQFFADVAPKSSYVPQIEYAIRDNKDYSIRAVIALLKQFRAEIELGFFQSIESKITGEVFTDFLYMGEHFITEEYYDAAAVMIGGVLEGHLRKLCILNEIPLTEFKDGKDQVKGANWMNDDLRKKAVYDKQEFKSVNLLLEIRNDAAHTVFLPRSFYNSQEVQGVCALFAWFVLQNIPASGFRQ